MLKINSSLRFPFDQRRYSGGMIMKKTIILLTLCMLLLSAKGPWAAEVTVPDNYPTIQEAIDNNATGALIINVKGGYLSWIQVRYLWRSFRVTSSMCQVILMVMPRWILRTISSLCRFWQDLILHCPPIRTPAVWL